MMKSLIKWILIHCVSAVAIVIHLLPGPNRHSRRTRSLWAGSPIINMAVNARAERLLGVDADSLVYETYYITDAFTYDLSRWRRLPMVGFLLPYLTLVWACRKYDRFHFYCDRGLLVSPAPYRIDEGELRLLRRLRKQVFFWTYGADVRTTNRTQSLGEFNCCLHCPAPGKACICDDADGKWAHSIITKYGRATFSMGDMIEYVPGGIKDIFFWPVDLDSDEGRRFAPAYPDADADRPLRVAHAPNHRHFKGSDYLFEIVRKLQGEDLPVELELVERKPNAEALDIYRRADVIFDQCLIGFHGYLAQEAMALGKPVMCFIRKPEEYLLHAEECPILNTPPDRIESVLRSLLKDRSRLGQLGRQGRKYIERYHTPERFADRLEDRYRQLGVESP